MMNWVMLDHPPSNLVADFKFEIDVEFSLASLLLSLAKVIGYSIFISAITVCKCILCILYYSVSCCMICMVLFASTQ